MLEHSTQAACAAQSGHPYTDAEIESAPKDLEGKTEMDAVIAYLQDLGTAIKTRR